VTGNASRRESTTADEGAMAQGLGELESAARLMADGANELGRDRRRGLLASAGAVLKEPMLLLLLGAGAIHLLLGSLEEALALLCSVGVVIAITLVRGDVLLLAEGDRVPADAALLESAHLEVDA
jgi:P-type Ca2+ transporter type 2C